MGDPGFAKTASAVLLVAACAITAVGLVTKTPHATGPATICLLLYLLVARRILTRGAYLFLGALVLACCATYWRTGQITLLMEAAQRGLFLTFFVTSMTMLRIPATRSDTVTQCGQAIVRQPPGFRYLALTTGAQMFGVILNLGSVSLLGSMANTALPKPTNAEEERRNAIRQKRMSLAILRGFSPVAMWSPTSIVLAILLEMQPGFSWVDYVPYGLSATIGFLLLGAFVDWLFYPTPVHRPVSPGLKFTAVSVARFCLIVLAIFAIGTIVSYGLDITMILGILVSVPISSMGWLAVQNSRETKAKAKQAWRSAATEYTTQFADFSTEVAIFFTSGALSVLVGPLVHADAMLTWIIATHVDQAVILAGICTGIVFLGAIGVTPFLTVLMAAATLLHTSPFSEQGLTTTIALGMAWSGSLGMSPFMAATRLVAKLAGATALEVCLRWNLSFTAIWLVVMNIFIFAVF